jgi:uncharacterized protein (DUF427 family)
LYATVKKFRKNGIDTTYLYKEQHQTHASFKGDCRMNHIRTVVKGLKNLATAIENVAGVMEAVRTLAQTSKRRK